MGLTRTISLDSVDKGLFELHKSYDLWKLAKAKNELFQILYKLVSIDYKTIK